MCEALHIEGSAGELRSNESNLDGEGESDMNAAIAWLLPRVSAKSVDDIESFIAIALFCGVGLLLSLSVLIADQYIPGEWF